MRLYLLFIGLLLTSLLKAQTFTGTGGPIADDGSFSTFPIFVVGLDPANLDNQNGLVQVCVNITHTWLDDLEIALIAPDGTMVVLSNRHGDDGDDYQNTCFSMSATVPIQNGTPPFTGQFLPDGNLSDVNNGQDGNGEWLLYLEDHYPFEDEGTLIGWSLSFGDAPDPPDPPTIFESSNLPLVFFNTNGQAILENTQIVSQIGIVYNGPGERNFLDDPYNHYYGYGKVKFRGQSSLSFDKKSYSIETANAGGNEIDASLLGMPEEEDWVLHGPYSDKTHLRNDLTMKVARDMGWYSSRTRHVELIVNGEYMGLYVLMERIKKENGRVDIADLTLDDISGDQLTGGYILKIDKGDEGGWLSDYNLVGNVNKAYFQHVYPKEENITPEQLQYIKDYVGGFEDALSSPDFTNGVGKHYSEYADVGSFVDFFILNELGKNVDAYRLSTYFHKDKDSKNGKLTMGPFWDFNLAWFNADYCQGNNASGWMFAENCDSGIPFWWSRLFLDEPNFREHLKCRWNELRGDILSESYLFDYIDAKALELDESQERNFEKWDILGTYVWPNPATPATYEEEINNLKNWISQRLNWMDAEIMNLPDGDIEVNWIVNACDSYTSPSGSVWTTSGTYSDMVENANGCDSVFTINLNIENVDVSVQETGSDLIANATDVEYQWLDCDDDFIPIPGATDQNIYPVINGNFAVQITDGNCVGVSDCYLFFSVNTQEHQWASEIGLHPNPTDGRVELDLTMSSQKELSFSVRNVLGELLWTERLNNQSRYEFDLDFPSGIYFIELENDENEKAVFKVLKK